MNADEVTRILAQSSQNDWIVDDETGAFTYKNDLALHIKRADYDDYNSFNEPWAVRHPDSNACSVEYTVHYGGVSGNPRKFRHSALWNFLGGWSAA